MLRRDVVGGQTEDTPIVSFTHHFDVPASIVAVPYAASASGAAVPAGDPSQSLVLRLSAVGDGADATSTMLYQPNGDGAITKGQLPYIQIPE